MILLNIINIIIKVSYPKKEVDYLQCKYITYEQDPIIQHLSKKFTEILNNRKQSSYSTLTVLQSKLLKQLKQVDIFSDEYILTEESNPLLFEIFKDCLIQSYNLYNITNTVYTNRFLYFLRNNKQVNRLSLYKEFKNELYIMKDNFNKLLDNDHIQLVKIFFSTFTSIRLGTIYKVCNQWYNFLKTFKDISSLSNIPKNISSLDDSSFTININKFKQYDNPDYIDPLDYQFSKELYRQSIHKYDYILTFPKEFLKYSILTNIHIQSISDIEIVPYFNQFKILVHYIKEVNVHKRYKKKAYPYSIQKQIGNVR